MHGQSRLHSFFEAGVNILIGFWLSWLVNLIVLPWYGFHVTPGESFWITMIFTAVSLVRAYVVRRAFNHWHRKQYAQGR